jgi:hypothetical protein
MLSVGIGILSWFTWLISNKPIGCSTSFSRTAGMIEKLFRGKKVENKLYYQEVKPEVDWQWMLVLGIVIGALVSSLLSGDFRFQLIPSVWENAFGDNAVLRLSVALNRRYIAWIRFEMGRRLHQRSRYHGTMQTCRFKLDFCHMLFYWRYFDGTIAF